MEAGPSVHEEREDFIAVINHRLRNPVLANDRAVKLLVDGDFGELAPNQKTILEHILNNNKEVDRLLRMLVDIYEYRSGSKAIQSFEFDLGTAMDKVISKYKPVAARQKISLIDMVRKPYFITCDGPYITTLVEHILENAINHARSTVTIECRLEHARVCLAISDDGLGIEESRFSSLFSRFHIQSGTQYPAVTGIGLCLCAEIAKAHGGLLTCESEVGKGTTFLLLLPHSVP